MYVCDMPGPPLRTTNVRVPDLRSPKIVYEVWNVSEPKLNVTELEVLVGGLNVCRWEESMYLRESGRNF